MPPFGLFAGKPPDNLGVRDGRLAPCPDSPNCVSSQAPDRPHRVEPIRFDGSPEEALRRVREVVLSMPGASVVREEPDYLRAEFTSAVFGFVDDVELLVDREARVIHVRSASRLGYSDLGANRKRIEEIRQRFERSPL